MIMSSRTFKSDKKLQRLKLSLELSSIALIVVIFYISIYNTFVTYDMIYTKFLIC